MLHRLINKLFGRWINRHYMDDECPGCSICSNLEWPEDGGW